MSSGSENADGQPAGRRIVWPNTAAPRGNPPGSGARSSAWKPGVLSRLLSPPRSTAIQLERRPCTAPSNATNEHEPTRQQGGPAAQAWPAPHAPPTAAPRRLSAWHRPTGGEFPIITCYLSHISTWATATMTPAYRHYHRPSTTSVSLVTIRWPTCALLSGDFKCTHCSTAVDGHSTVTPQRHRVPCDRSYGQISGCDLGQQFAERTYSLESGRCCLILPKHDDEHVKQSSSEL